MTCCILSVFIQCNAPCVLYQETQANCSSAHCGCSDPFLQAEANCLLCQTKTPEDQVTVQILFDGMFDRGRRKYESESLIVCVLQRRSLSVRRTMSPLIFTLTSRRRLRSLSRSSIVKVQVRAVLLACPASRIIYASFGRPPKHPKGLLGFANHRRTHRISYCPCLCCFLS